MAYIDEQGNEWQRIDGDPICWKRSDGLSVYSSPENTFEYICEITYKPQAQVKTDAERIAELEAQLAALLSKLS